MVVVTASNGAIAGSAARSLNPSENPSSPYFYNACDHPGLNIINVMFNGENYVSWSKAVIRALQVKNKLPLINGSLPVPSMDDRVLYDAWERANALVLSWINLSLEDDVKNSLLYLQEMFGSNYKLGI